MNLVTVVVSMGFVVCFLLATNFYCSENRSLTRLGHALVLFGLAAMVLLFGGLFHQTWEAYVNLVWEQKP